MNAVVSMDAVVAAEQTPDLLDLTAVKARVATQLAPHRLNLPIEVRTAALVGRGNAGRLIRRLLRVATGPGRLSAHEYFYYRLYDPSLSDEESLRYVGKGRIARLYEPCNDVHWYAALEDKLLCYMAVAGAGLPIPTTRAVYTQTERFFGAPVIRDPRALEGFLRDPSHYPLFVKTIDGLGSVGASSLASTDGTWIHFTTGETARVEAVARFIHEFGGEGFLLQDRVEPHPEFHAAFGPTLPTIRFLLLLSPEGARMESAVLKIPSARNPADNYWRAGNMLGALDGSGAITRVVTGAGAELQEQTHHPETGAPLIGLRVPFWEEASQLCRQAATIFPRVRTQSWDVAITESGPMLVEGNYGGAINLHQLANRRGALTPSFVEHLRRCGCKLVKSPAAAPMACAGLTRTWPGQHEQAGINRLQLQPWNVRSPVPAMRAG